MLDTNIFVGLSLEERIRIEEKMKENPPPGPGLYDMSKEEFDVIMTERFAEFEAGKSMSADELKRRMKEYIEEKKKASVSM